ncbi:MAG: TVP38/TMEM64 family protein, partial [Pseudomonadota bacterium]
MTNTPAKKHGLVRNLPLIAILSVAVIGAFADNREALIAFRDANYLVT